MSVAEGWTPADEARLTRAARLLGLLAPLVPARLLAALGDRLEGRRRGAALAARALLLSRREGGAACALVEMEGWPEVAAAEETGAGFGLLAPTLLEAEAVAGIAAIHLGEIRLPPAERSLLPAAAARRLRRGAPTLPEGDDRSGALAALAAARIAVPFPHRGSPAPERRALAAVLSRQVPLLPCSAAARPGPTLWVGFGAPIRLGPDDWPVPPGALFEHLPRPRAVGGAG